MTIWLAKKDWLREYGAHRLRVLASETGRVYDAGLMEQLQAQREPVLTIDGNKATIRVTGPTTEAGPDFWDLLFNYGGVAYSEIQEAFMTADENLAEDGEIEFRVNTPGGEASGVEFTHDVIADVATRRTVRTVASSLLASAGVWYTAPSTEIIAEGRSTLVGSVGVATQVVDWSEYYETFGVYVHNLTNDASPDKRPDLSTEEGRGVIVEELNQIYQVFIESVVAGRGDATTIEKIESLKGAVVAADKGVEAGFFDRLANSTVHNNNKAPQKAAGKEKGNKMNLTEFLSENPAAKQELEAIEANAKAAGVAEAREAIQKDAAAVMPIVKSDKYPAKFTEAAVAVLSGERSLQSFEDFVALYDMDHEGEKSEEAKDESEKTDDTPADDPAKVEMNMKQDKFNKSVALVKSLNP